MPAFKLKIVAADCFFLLECRCFVFATRRLLPLSQSFLCAGIRFFIYYTYDCTGILTSVHLAEKRNLDHLHVQYVIADCFCAKFKKKYRQVFVHVDCLSFSFLAEAETWLDTWSGQSRQVSVQTNVAYYVCVCVITYSTVLTWWARYGATVDPRLLHEGNVLHYNLSFPHCAAFPRLTTSLSSVAWYSPHIGTMLAPVEHTRPECCIFSITKGLGNDDNVHYYFYCYNLDFFFLFLFLSLMNGGGECS